MKRILAAVALCCASVVAAEWGRAPNGEIWNVRSKRFQYAPTLAFQEVSGAVEYRFEVVDDFHRLTNIVARKAVAELSSVWPSLPVGYVSVTCSALGTDGRVVGTPTRRTFWKKSAFAAGAYEPRAMGPVLARARMLDHFIGMPETRYLIERGEPDPSYPLNGYPTKMLSAEINSAVAYLESLGGKKPEGHFADLLTLAEKAAAWLIADSVPAGQPLAFFPRTYSARGSEYGRFVGQQDQIMLVYPAEAGAAYLRLHRFTRDAKWLAAAERLAGTYRKLQGADGTWPLRMDAKTGAARGSQRLVPIQVITFLDDLADVTGAAEWRDVSARAFAWLEAGPLSDWNWDGQFEDGRPVEQKHANLSNWMANLTAQWLLRRFPGDAKRLAQAKELAKFVEDQFVEWTPPYCHGRDARLKAPEDDGSWSFFCRPTDNWMTPCALEQYNCYVPVNASAATCARTFFALGRATGDETWRAKGRALLDAQTRMIESDGFLNTWSVRDVKRNDHRYHTWLNCTLAVLDAFADYVEAGKN